MDDFNERVRYHQVVFSGEYLKFGVVKGIRDNCVGFWMRNNDLGKIDLQEGKIWSRIEYILESMVNKV